MIEEQARTTSSKHLATSNQAAVASARESAGWPGRVLIPAALVAFGVLLLGFVTRPPQYTARAAFVVDWNRMPSVPGDETVEKMRNTARKELMTEIETLPWSEEISDFLDEHLDAHAEPAAKDEAISKAQNWLSTTLVAQTNDCDCFAIEMSDADPRLAESIVGCVLQESISRFNTQARILSALAVARAKANRDALDKREAERRQSGESGSVELDLQRFAAEASAVKNLEGIFKSPVRVVELPHVEKQSGQHALHVLLTAIALGGVVGIAGIGLRKLAGVGKSPNRAKAGDVMPAPPQIPPPLIAPPKIVPWYFSRPPVLPPPLPR